MSSPIKNLTNPDEIIHAFLVKGSRTAISDFAKTSKWSRPYISQHIHGHRRKEEVLQEIANHLGCGVYGVMPKCLVEPCKSPAEIKESVAQDRPEMGI